MSNPETASIIERLIACRDTLKVVERQYSVNLQPERAAMADAANALAALAQPKEGEALSDEVVERAARADADMAAALLEGLEALANTPMNIDFSVWSRFAFNVQMIAKRLRRAAITPAGGVSGQYLYEAFWKRQPDQDKRPTPPWSEQSDAIKTMWDGIAGDAASPKGQEAEGAVMVEAKTTLFCSFCFKSSDDDFHAFLIQVGRVRPSPSQEEG